MKASYMTQYGGPEVLTYGDQPEPNIGPGEVKIRVRAAALNHLDVFRRAGQRGTKTELAEPFIPGCDMAGEVVEISDGVISLTIGDRVIVNPGVTCNKCEHCLAGNDSMCRQYSMIGSATNGAYAQFVKVPAENVHKITAAISWEEMAAIPLTTLTAYHMLITLVQLKAGETVLIQAVGSGVGTAALQIAKLVGARTIVTASTDSKLEKASELGANETINYSNEEFPAKVKDLTEGRGVDVVFDHIGSQTFLGNIASLSRGGRYVNCGITSGYKAELHIGQLFTKQIKLFGSFMGTKQDMFQVVNLVNQGKLRGIVDKVYDLKDAPKAHQAMEDRDVFGKLILQIP